MTARPIRSAKVRIDDIVEKWDMRGVHKLRERVALRKLKQGSCIVAFNKAQSIARIVDWKGGVHTFYCEKNEFFDLTSLKAFVKAAFYVEIEPGANAKRQAKELYEVAA